MVRCARLLGSDGGGKPKSEVVGVSHDHGPDEAGRDTPGGRPDELSCCWSSRNMGVRWAERKYTGKADSRSVTRG